MEVIKSTFNIGIEKPFTFLHVSDIHMAETDENDSPARRDFAAARKRGFEFSLSAIDFIKEYVKKTGYPLINTGDMLDFVTPQNLCIAQKFVQDTNMTMGPVITSIGPALIIGFITTIYIKPICKGRRRLTKLKKRLV